MAGFKRFEDIEAWQMGRQLVLEVYRITRDDVFSRDLGLKDQIRRASVSVMNNIAEGFERGSTPDFVKFLFIARGSAGEVRSLLYVAKDLSYIAKSDFDTLSNMATRISACIHGLIKHLKSR